jgi:hypothetical protein
MFEGHVQMTIVPELPDLLLKREQNPMKRILKWNDCHSAVQTLLKGYTIERIQRGEEFPKEPAECILNE